MVPLRRRPYHLRSGLLQRVSIITRKATGLVRARDSQNLPFFYCSECHSDELKTSCDSLGGRVWNRNYCILEDYYTVIGPVCWGVACFASTVNDCAAVGGTNVAKWWCLVKGCDYTGTSRYAVRSSYLEKPEVSSLTILLLRSDWTDVFGAGGGYSGTVFRGKLLANHRRNGYRRTGVNNSHPLL